MNSQNDVVIGIPVNSVSYAAQELQHELITATEPNGYCDECNQDKMGSIDTWILKLRLKANYHVQSIKDQKSKISRTVKGKLSSAKRFLQTGWAERTFTKVFSAGETEKLVDSTQCFLSTTMGPLEGTLFISTEKVAFLSDRLLKLTSPNGEVARFRYKVMIPLAKIKRAIPIENSEMTNKKYIQIVTVDEFDFWFMGFASYQRFIDELQIRISGERSCL